MRGKQTCQHASVKVGKYVGVISYKFAKMWQKTYIDMVYVEELLCSSTRAGVLGQIVNR